MKVYINLLMIFILLTFSSVIVASLTIPFAVYTVQELNADGTTESIPDSVVLVPQLFAENMGSGMNPLASAVLRKLKEINPEVYKYVEYIPTEDIMFSEGQIVKFKVMLKDQKEFKIIMSELVYSLNWNPDMYNRKLKFVFTDDGLKKKFSGKIFAKKDVKIPAFELKKIK